MSSKKGGANNKIVLLALARVRLEGEVNVEVPGRGESRLQVEVEPCENLVIPVEARLR
jgi:hypothetical protein